MTLLTARQFVIRLAACGTVVVALLVVSPGVGTESASFGWRDAWRARLGMDMDRAELVGRPLVDFDGDGAISEEEYAAFVSTAQRIGFDQRFARSLLALLVGMTLGLCGATFQVLFRNPLATPYTLGIASGGSLGALLAVRWGWTAVILGLSSLTLSAFVGALGIVAAVFVVARGHRRLTSNELLLAGVTIGLFCSAMMMFITSVSSQRQTFFIVRWMMGSLDPLTASSTTILWPLLAMSWLVLVMQGRALNQYRLGDELAASRGVSVIRLQVICVLFGSLATALVVAHCGPIGFVGLVVPHMVALLFSGDCRMLLPASAIVGGGFLIVCDWASQLAMRLAGRITGQNLGSATLPIGVVTALIGVPIFLILLRARRERPAGKHPA